MLRMLSLRTQREEIFFWKRGNHRSCNGNGNVNCNHLLPISFDFHLYAKTFVLCNSRCSITENRYRRAYPTALAASATPFAALRTAFAASATPFAALRTEFALSYTAFATPQKAFATPKTAFATEQMLQTRQMELGQYNDHTTVS